MTASPHSSTARRFPTYGRSQHLREITSQIAQVTAQHYKNSVVNPPSQLAFCSEQRWTGRSLPPTPRVTSKKNSHHASHIWGNLLARAGTTTLQTATLALIHSTAESCVPAWYRSAHTSPIELVINDALRTVTGCLLPTPADNLPILAGTQPSQFRCKGATLSLSRRAVEPRYLLNSALTSPPRAEIFGISNRDTHIHKPQSNASVQ